MLSNSDPKNEDLADNFFDALYQGYRIERVPANRSKSIVTPGNGVRSMN